MIRTIKPILAAWGKQAAEALRAPFRSRVILCRGSGILLYFAVGLLFEEFLVGLDHGLTCLDNKKEKKSDAKEEVDDVEQDAADCPRTPTETVGGIHRHRRRRIDKCLEKRPALSEPEKQSARHKYYHKYDAKRSEICVMDQTLNNGVYKLKQKQYGCYH